MTSVRLPSFSQATVFPKSEEELNDFYAPGSTVFQMAMGCSEPRRLDAMCRSRKYFRAT
jgi:hypothetical protein